MTAVDNLAVLAGAPGGIASIRQLVRDLAVGGRLLPDLNPAAWPAARLAELVQSFQNGVSSRGASDGTSVVVLRLADIKNGSVSLDEPRQLTLDEATIEKYRLAVGDVLVIRVNGSADLVGRFVVCESSVGLPCDHFIRLRLDQTRIDAGYLKLVGDCTATRTKIQGLFVSTAGQKTVNQTHIGSLSFALPQLADQHRLVAKVDELMALCDRLEARQQDTEAAHARLVQALLDSLAQARDAEEFQACWRRLTHAFAETFTSEASVEALAQAVRTLAFRGALSRDGAADWMQVRVNDAVQFLNGYAFKSEWFVPHGIRLVRNVNIAHGSIDWRDAAFVPADRSDEFAAFALKAGDVLLTLDRPIISTGLKVAVVRDSDLPCLLLQRVARLAPREHQVRAAFLLHWLRSPLFIDAIDPGRSNGVPHISTKQVGSMTIPLPALDEQDRIVASLDNLLALCDQLKARITAARAKHAQLAEALVAQAVA